MNVKGGKCSRGGDDACKGILRQSLQSVNVGALVGTSVFARFHEVCQVQTVVQVEGRPGPYARHGCVQPAWNGGADCTENHCCQRGALQHMASSGKGVSERQVGDFGPHEARRQLFDFLGDGGDWHDAAWVIFEVYVEIRIVN